MRKGTKYESKSDFNGFVKWDGCSEFHAFYHICSFDMFESLHGIYKEIYNRSLEILGSDYLL